jgi:hypothetical protein
MSGSLEQAYVSVERAYGQGDFSGALQLAQALQPQVPPGRSDLLDQRLQLLIGHIHLYGLNQPDQALAAYNAVLQGCSEPSYRELAAQGVEVSRQLLPADAGDPSAAFTPPVATSGAAGGAPPTGQTTAATPWMTQLQDPQQALAQIQEVTAPEAPGQPGATPWQQADVPPAEAATEVGGPETSNPETSGLAVQPAETGETETPEDPQAIIPVVVTVEEEAEASPAQPAPQSAPEADAADAPMAESQPSFSEEEWADFQRGLLLVDLTNSNAGPIR